MLEAAQAPMQADPIPAMPRPATPEEGARQQYQAILLMMGFGLPAPSLEPIVYHDIRL